MKKCTAFWGALFSAGVRGPAGMGPIAPRRSPPIASDNGWLFVPSASLPGLTHICLVAIAFLRILWRARRATRLRET